ncbi:MAG: hypothetical protein ACK4UQ_06520 [Brevundimonas sp.]
MEIPWANIGEFLKAAVPSLIAAIVAWVGIQNWITAKNKLALDLFDRRHTAWRKAVTAIRAALDEIAESDGVTNVDVRVHTEALQDAIEDCYYLFGKEVIDALMQYRSMLETAAISGSKNADAIDASFASMSESWHRIFTLVEPYMMLDKIAVNRPAAPLAIMPRNRRA